MANIFQDKELENVHCTFPKAVHTAINVLKRTKSVEKIISTTTKCSMVSMTHLDILKKQIYLETLQIYLTFSMFLFTNTQNKKILASCFEFYHRVSLNRLLIQS